MSKYNRKVSKSELEMILACWSRNNELDKLETYYKLRKLLPPNRFSINEVLERVENLTEGLRLERVNKR